MLSAKMSNKRHQQQERQALLDGNSDDDDFFLSGPNAQPGRLVGRNSSNEEPDRFKWGDGDRHKRLQVQLDEVVDVMQDNINKTLNRGTRLDDLQDKSEGLSSNADVFRSRAKSLKQHTWWKECRMRILLAVVVVIILAIIVVPIIVKYSKSDDSGKNP